MGAAETHAAVIHYLKGVSSGIVVEVHAFAASLPAPMVDVLRWSACGLALYGCAILVLRLANRSADRGQ